MKSLFRAFSKDKEADKEPAKDSEQTVAPEAANIVLFDADYFNQQMGIVGGGSTQFAEFVNCTNLSINPHPLFQCEYYRSQAKIDFKTPNESLQHYLNTGWKQNLSPHPLIAPFFVSKQLPEGGEQQSQLQRLLSKEASDIQPHPAFSKEFYEEQRGKTFESSVSALVDYWLNGSKSGLSPHPLFDPSFYLAKAKEAGLLVTEPLSHYLNVGYRQGLNPHLLFDSEHYASQESAAISDDYSPLVHYLVSGRKRDSSPHPLFNPRIFKAVEPKELFVEQTPALVRYLRNSRFCNELDPDADFDSQFYLENNPELVGKPINPLAHYITSGADTAAFSPFYQKENQQKLYQRFVKACVGKVIWNVVDSPEQIQFLERIQTDCTVVAVSITQRGYRRGLKKVKGIAFEIIRHESEGTSHKLCFDPSSQMNQITQLFKDSKAAGIVIHNFFSANRMQKDFLTDLRKPFSIHVGPDFDKIIPYLDQSENALEAKSMPHSCFDLLNDFKPHTLLNWKVSRKWFVDKAQELTVETESSKNFMESNFTRDNVQQVDFRKLIDRYAAQLPSMNETANINATSKTFRIGICASADASWTGGINYVNNLLSATKLAGLKSNIAVEGVVLAEEGQNVASFVSALTECSALIQLKKISDEELPQANLDCLFTAGNLLTSDVVPVVSWLYDFQHKEMPSFFSRVDLESRDSLFGQVAEHSEKIIVSSEHAKQIFSVYYPEALDKVVALPFVPLLDAAAWTNQDPSYVVEKYKLPEDFFYLPNQFWIHKNFECVIETLVRAKAQGIELTVVCTGSTSDSRDELYFPKILERVAVEGLRDHFIILGMVPRVDVVALMKRSISILQPSLYEGWSTSVEECKALNLPIILSDLPVHREQDPARAIYFDPFDANALLAALIKMKNSESKPVFDFEKLSSENRKNFENFGEKALDVFRKAIEIGPRINRSVAIGG